MATKASHSSIQYHWTTKDDGSLASAVEVLAEISSIDGSQWRLCLHPFSFKRDQNPDLGELLDNSSSNPFFNPAFLAASRERVTHNPISQMIIWEISGNQQHARMSIPVIHRKKTFYMPEHIASLTHDFAPLGNPLIDQRAESVVLQRLRQLLQLAFESGMPPLLLDYVSEDSPVFNLECEPGNGLFLENFSQGFRPTLKAGSIASNSPLASKKRLRELTRLLKKFNELGSVTFEKVTDPFDVILRFEEFLLLETRSWKGRQGSSIHTIKRDAAFARQSVNDLAREGKCAIFTMRLDGKVVASTILFLGRGKYFPWKTAYDDVYSKFSPGSQLMLKLSEEMMHYPDFVSADSLAKFGASWMTHLWPSEEEFRTFIFSSAERECSLIARRLQFKSGLKNFIKKTLRRD